MTTRWFQNGERNLNRKSRQGHHRRIITPGFWLEMRSRDRQVKRSSKAS